METFFITIAASAVMFAIGYYGPAFCKNLWDRYRKRNDNGTTTKTDL